MRVLFDGAAPVDYGQIYVTSRELPDMQAAFAGQVNGICGAGEPGALFLMTGTHYGRVRFTVELHDAEPPPAAPEWQDVVEVSLLPRGPAVGLVPWGSGPLAQLPLIPDGHDTGPLPVFRVRYCAAGMDEGRDRYGGHDPAGFVDGDHSYLDHRPDRYLLCFWPMRPADTADTAGARADAIQRQTSRSAAHWHDWAAGLAVPPALWEQVEAELRVRLARERRDEEHRQREETRRWGGRAPSERLRRVRGNVHGIALMDRDLVDGVAEVDAATQRRIAVWAARQAFTVAGIADLAWLAPAWAALDRGEPLPAEFTDLTALLTRIGGERAVSFSITALRPAGRRGTGPLGTGLGARVDPVAMALPALTAAAAPDPLQAALEAVWAAATAHTTRRAAFLAELRRVFPLVDRQEP
ncbi:hypothetical protein AB0K00_56430 [Dactylosporangium sp. NPDC049525]|uniref:hypothetical protein n=1 Tax=Dactylosporangium sp. NPDC049525 TaxID=3154730 RepID=UPI0034490038